MCTSLNDLEHRIRDLEYQIIECRNAGDYDLIPSIKNKLRETEAAATELRTAVPDFDQVPL
jgi:hypothetical protein